MNTNTFTVSVADLLAAQNPGYIQHVETADSAIVDVLAAKPYDTAHPIRVKKNLQITYGFRELVAAKRRGETEVVCVPATVQEELSA